MENLIDKALNIACKAHAGQVDKAGAPYILHPLRLALTFCDPNLQVVALLHDVVEDSDVTLDGLRDAGFGDEIICAIGALTKKNDEAYDDFINRVAKNHIAKQVKIKDLEDNMDITRFSNLTKNDLNRLAKYQKAYVFLNHASSTNSLA